MSHVYSISYSSSFALRITAEVLDECLCIRLPRITPVCVSKEPKSEVQSFFVGFIFGCPLKAVHIGDLILYLLSCRAHAETLPGEF